MHLFHPKDLLLSLSAVLWVKNRTLLLRAFIENGNKIPPRVCPVSQLFLRSNQVGAFRTGTLGCLWQCCGFRQQRASPHLRGFSLPLGSLQPRWQHTSVQGPWGLSIVWRNAVFSPFLLEEKLKSKTWLSLALTVLSGKISLSISQKVGDRRLSHCTSPTFGATASPNRISNHLSPDPCSTSEGLRTPRWWSLSNHKANETRVPIS